MILPQETDTQETAPATTGLHRTVILTGWVSFFTDFSSEMIYPLLPMFLTSLGAGTAFIGLVEGIAEATASLLKLASGWFSDRVSRRKELVFLGYTLSSISRPLMGVALAPWHVLVLRFSDRVGKGIRTAPRDALVADVTPEWCRGRAFGFQRAMDHAGAVVGPLVATVLLTLLMVRERTVFLLAAVPAAVAVALIVFIKEPPQPRQPRVASLLTSDGSVGRVALAGQARPKLSLANLSPRLRCVLGLLILFALGNSSDAFLLLRAREVGVNLKFIPALWAMHHVVKSSLATPLGALSDRIGRLRVIIFGWLIYALVYTGFAFASRQEHIWILFAVYGVFFAMTEGAERALVSDLCEPEQRGAAFGLYNFSLGLAALAASLLTGWLWQRYNPRVALLTGAVIALTAVVLMAAMRPLLRRNSS